MNQMPTSYLSAGSDHRKVVRLSVTTLFILASLILLPVAVKAQQYDILLKGGHVIDPKNGINSQMDIAVKDDIIARVASDIPASEAGQVIHVSGLYVTPGLIDIHTHVFHGTDKNRYLSKRYFAIYPYRYSYRYGLTKYDTLSGV